MSIVKDRVKNECSYLSAFWSVGDEKPSLGERTPSALKLFRIYIGIDGGNVWIVAWVGMIDSGSELAAENSFDNVHWSGTIVTDELI